MPKIKFDSNLPVIILDVTFQRRQKERHVR
jgi:hypothetical protein